MQPGSRCGHRTFVPGENGLEVLHIGLVRSFLDPLRHRSLSECEQSLLELLVRSVIEEPEGASAGGGVVNHLGHHTVVLSEVELVADSDFAGRVHHHIPKPLLLVELAKQEYDDVSLGFLLFAVEFGRENFGVVEDEVVALSEIIYNVLELPVFDLSSIFVQHHKLALISPAGRLGCYPVFREIEVKL